MKKKLSAPPTHPDFPGHVGVRGEPQPRERLLDSFEKTEEAVDREAQMIACGVEPVGSASATAIQALKESDGLDAAPRSRRTLKITGGFLLAAAALGGAFFLGRLSARD